ncbi:MAG: ArnT family glycosyltransferase [Myxococcota bacterium]
MNAGGANGARGLLGVFALALLLRAAFVAWAPGIPTGDDLWHNARALGLANGVGYVNLDGSPSIAWMPGWPLLLAGLYALFGPHTGLGLAANALLGALTSAGVGLLGTRLFSPRTGLAAGLLYACWPGNVYYTATLMSETLFNAALVGCLLLVVRATDPGRSRPGRAVAAAGLAFGAVAWIKAEPLILAPVLLVCLLRGPWPARTAARHAALFLVVTGLAMAPWVVRNYVHFGRLVVTTSTGPANAWLGHHAGADGGQSLATANRQARYLREHPDESGYALAWRFAREHPREELSLVWKKLVLTYGSDDDAVTLIRGVQPRKRRLLAVEVEGRLRRVANAWWAGVCGLALLGLWGVRRWPGRTRMLVLGVPACWLVVHLVFIGGSRFHVPETPSIALAAGAGVTRLLEAIRRRRARPGSPPGPRPGPAPPGAPTDPPPPTA